MPIYEYHCEKCGHEFEVLQKSFDVDEAPCEECGAPSKRMISNTSFVLKGTGWYVTDYKSNGGCSAAGGNGASGNGKAEKSDAASTSCASAPSGGCSSCAGASGSSASASSSSS